MKFYSVFLLTFLFLKYIFAWMGKRNCFMEEQNHTEYDGQEKAEEIRRQVLHCLIENGGLMISDISSRCGYSVPTVAKYINALIRRGLVMSAGKKSYSRGKKPTIYMCCRDAAYFIGVDLQSHALFICAMALSGEIIAEEFHHNLLYSNTPLFGRCLHQSEQFH